MNLSGHGQVRNCSTLLHSGRRAVNDALLGVHLDLAERSSLELRSEVPRQGFQGQKVGMTTRPSVLPGTVDVVTSHPTDTKAFLNCPFATSRRGDITQRECMAVRDRTSLSRKRPKPVRRTSQRSQPAPRPKAHALRVGQ